jgi:hypothetical protein
LREIASFNAQQQFWAARGEPQRAEAAAWGMLQAAKKAVSQYGALALSIDDPVKRAEVIAKAHNQYLPDGEQLKITGKSGDGAKFELFDNKGQLTEKGVLAMDDMVKMATGMHDGTHYLQAMTNFATAAPTAAERALQKRADTRAAFEERIAGQDDRDYISTLSDEDRKAYLAMDPRERKEFSQRHERRQQEDAKAQRFDERNQLQADREEIKAGNRADDVADRWLKFDINRDDKAMATARREEIQAFDMARKQGNWETMRDDRLSINERWRALKERDLSDRNSRLDQSLAARQKRYEEIDRRMIEARGTKDSAIRLSPKERAELNRTQAVDTAEAQGVAGVESAIPLTPGGSEGTMEEQRSRAVGTATGPIRAQAAYQRIAPEERAIDEGDFAEIRKKVPEAWKETKNPTDHLVASQIAAEIRAASGNKLTNDDAVNMTMQALSGNAEPKVLPGGRLQIGNLPPVAISGESLIQLAAMRARVTEKERQGKYGVDYRSQTALPGATAPTSSAAVSSEVGRIKGQRALELSPPETALSRGLRATGRALMPDVDRAEADRQAVEFLRRDEERRQRMRRTGLAR